MSKLLLVEDDRLVGTMVRINLEAEGHEVIWETHGGSGATRAVEDCFDLVLLDIFLPGKDGMEILAEMRSRGVGTPVLMLTARSDVDSKVDALEAGADDYLTKPFDVAELVARVKALVRRSQAERQIPSDKLVRVGGFKVDLDTREAETRDGPVVLSEKEAAILGVLVRAGGRPVSRADIIEEVWGMDAFPTERTVDNFIKSLRRRFEEHPDQPRHILTVRGAGYRFVA